MGDCRRTSRSLSPARPAVTHVFFAYVAAGPPLRRGDHFFASDDDGPDAGGHAQLQQQGTIKLGTLGASSVVDLDETVKNVTPWQLWWKVHG